jgi:hypothetical protein
VSVDSFGFESNELSTHTAISPEGRFVVFRSRATNLVQGDTNNVDDDFLHDRVSGRTERVSVDNAGAQAYATSGWPVVSRDAGRIAFASAAPFDPTDSNAAWDAYVRECPLPTTYCTAKTNSLGCMPAITSTGVPLATWPNGYVLGARNVLNQKVGILLYSTTSAAALPFHGGTLCVHQPVIRTPLQHSGGSTVGSDCTGSFYLDFNTRIASGVDPSLVAGAQVWAQYWSRDPGFAPPQNSNLTDALSFVIDP